MHVDIGLLGRPAVTVDGQSRPLAGNKTWALLARVALGGGSTRRDLARLLWPDADDPSAACRWTILQVRRALEPGATLADVDGSIEIVPADGASVWVDVLALHAGTMSLDHLAGVGLTLLDGVDLRDAPDFEDWLARERNRAASALGATLRWAAAVSATTDIGRGITCARRALELDPFDDAANETLVSFLVASGDRRAAEEQLERIRRRYADELGIEIPPEIRRGLERPVPAATSKVGTAASAEALLDVAASREASGDYTGAIDAARRALNGATGVPELEARALLQLGSILVHSIRGRDREAVGLLDRALRAAVTAGNDALAAEAEREIAWVRFLGAEYGAAEGILRRSLARSAAIDDDRGAARALVVIGACQSDRAEYALAAASLEEAIVRLRSLGDRWEAFALAFLARVRLLTGAFAEAIELGDRAAERCRETGWLSLLPWPMVVAAEASLRLAPSGGTSERFDRAYALACEIGDPCWEAFSLRGRGLVARLAGEDAEAEQLLVEGLQRARSLPDVYAWAPASILADLVELQQGRNAEHLAAALALTRRGPMPALLERVVAASAVDE